MRHLSPNLLAPDSSQQDQLHSDGPRRWPLLLLAPKNCSKSPQGEAHRTSHLPPQLCTAEAEARKLQLSLEAPVLYPASPHEVKSSPEIRQAKNTEDHSPSAQLSHRAEVASRERQARKTSGYCLTQCFAHKAGVSAEEKQVIVPTSSPGPVGQKLCPGRVVGHKNRAL